MPLNCCRTKAAASAFSGLGAILLPKCPLCIAAWAAASTGIALPAIVTGSIRPALWAGCLLSIFLAVRVLRPRSRGAKGTI